MIKKRERQIEYCERQKLKEGDKIWKRKESGKKDFTKKLKIYQKTS